MTRLSDLQALCDAAIAAPGPSPDIDEQFNALVLGGVSPTPPASRDFVSYCGLVFSKFPVFAMDSGVSLGEGDDAGPFATIRVDGERLHAHAASVELASIAALTKLAMRGA